MYSLFVSAAVYQPTADLIYDMNLSALLLDGSLTFVYCSLIIINT